MKRVPLQGDYVREGDRAIFTVPNPDQPEKPFVVSVLIVGEELEFHPDRSAGQRRVLASLGL